MTPLPEFDNPREKLVAVVEWLGYMEEELSVGLKSTEDAVKLYDYWMTRGDDLPEFPDQTWDDEGRVLSVFRIHALGYDPLSDGEIYSMAEDLYYQDSGVKDEISWDDARNSVKDLYIQSVYRNLYEEYKITGGVV